MSITAMINVLSLFDGISCGQIALERAGIKVSNYFASEIDKNAIKVTQHNYPSTIQLGSVIDVKAENLSKIDLLIGGSPCQGFSFMGNQLNFDDPRSKLFFEYLRLLKECNPTYFFLENVKMRREYQDTISKELGVEPILIDSGLVSAQHRERLYWTNISNITQPNNKNILLKDILESDILFSENDKVWTYNADKPSKQNKKAKCLRACAGGITKGIGVYSADNKLWRKMTPIECERLQTVPDNYTKSISNNQRYKSLGNCWTVDLITHIFSFLPKELKD
jgi:DNA-cytosine methyltransferase